MKPSGVALPDLPVHVLYFGSRSIDRRVDRSLVTASWCLHWNQTRTATVVVDGRRISLGPERLLLMPPRSEVHETLQAGEEHTYLHFTLGPHFDRVRPRPLVLPARGEIRALCVELARIYRRNPEDTQAVFSAHALIALLLRQLAPDLWEATGPDPRVNALVGYMHGAYGGEISNRDLARRAGMATNSLVRLFRQEMGQPPRHYLTTIRVQAAARLLQHTGLPIDTIARRCGFCDRNYFSSVFRRRFGTGPATYRRENAAP